MNAYRHIHNKGLPTLANLSFIQVCLFFKALVRQATCSLPDICENIIDCKTYEENLKFNKNGNYENDSYSL